MSGIYTITNTVNGKCYVGSAMHIKYRLKDHLSYLKKGAHQNKLQRAWDKYGESAFELKAILICAKSDLLFYEQRAIDVFDSVKNGYNICFTAKNWSGCRHRPESNAKNSASHKGMKLGPASLDRIAKIAKANRGKKRSPEVIEQMRITSTGRKHTAETKAKVSAASKGHITSEAAKVKISTALTGIKRTDETRAKIAAANIGKQASPETKIKLSEMRRGRKFSIAHKENLSVALKIYYAAYPRMKRDMS